jgi:pSer/pThr/pTyr-binding forkhead associated (FHA) protein
MPEILLVPTGEAAAPNAASARLAVTQLPCVVGRHPTCDLWLSDPMVSRRHCALWLRQGRVWVADLSSRNGTRVNGEPLETARPLEDGDRLELGRLPFQVRLADSAQVAPTLRHSPAGPDLPGEGAP